MTKLAGTGPVFAFEWLMAARRWQTYAMRSTTVLLLGAIWIVWLIDTDASRGGWLTALEVNTGEVVQANQRGDVQLSRRGAGDTVFDVQTPGCSYENTASGCGLLDRDFDAQRLQAVD